MQAKSRVRNRLETHVLGTLESYLYLLMKLAYRGRVSVIYSSLVNTPKTQTAEALPRSSTLANGLNSGF